MYEIVLRDNTTGTYFPVPVLPEKIQYRFGDTQAETVQIVDLGDVNFINGRELDTFGWKSFFPGKYDPNYCTTATLLKPIEYQELITKWKDEQTTVQVVCTAGGINKPMYVKSFTPSLEGADGDIYYQLELVEVRTLAPRMVSTTAIKVTPYTEPIEQRPAVASPQPASRTYTIRSGDSVTAIAKRLGIRDWRNGLYIPNKKPNGPLGPDPSKIYPGQVLKY